MISTLVTGFLEAKVAFFGYNLRYIWLNECKKLEQNTLVTKKVTNQLTIHYNPNLVIFLVLLFQTQKWIARNPFLV